MNDIIKALFERKSMRVYEDKPVTAETKKLLLEATLQAPSAGNQIMYSIIDVTDPKLKLALSKTCDNQPFIATAPAVFVFVADQTRWHKSFELAGANPRELGVGDIMLATTDTAIAAQNMVVAAESLGLGSCYIGDVIENCEQQRELLNLPLTAIPVCMLVMGYPTEQQKERPKPPRFDIKYIVGENSYPHLTDEQLVEWYDDRRVRQIGGKNETPFNTFMNNFCTRKLNSPFSREMTRSIKEYFKAFK